MNCIFSSCPSASLFLGGWDSTGQGRHTFYMYVPSLLAEKAADSHNQAVGQLV